MPKTSISRKPKNTATFETMDFMRDARFGKPGSSALQATRTISNSSLDAVRVSIGDNGFRKGEAEAIKRSDERMKKKANKK